MGSSRKNTKEFLILYREKECLWRRSLSSYKSHPKRKKAYDELLRKLQEVDPTATIDDVKNKIVYHRSTFRRDLRRLLEAVENNCSPQPKLWYFPLLSSVFQEEFPAITSLNLQLDERNCEKDPEIIALESENAMSRGREPTSERNYRKTMKAVLLMFRQSPCLWRADHPDYGNQRKRKEAILPLAMKLREFDSAATSATVKRKLDFCRTAYKREVKKIITKRQMGQHYVPKLWYFDLLKFLYEPGMDELPPSPTDVEASDDFQNESFPCKVEWIEEDDGDVDPDGDPASSADERPLHEEFIEEDPYQEPGSEPEESTECSLKRIHEPDKVRFDYSGRNVAKKLRALGTGQRIHAEKLISDVLYNAELRNLDGNSWLILPDCAELT